MTRQVSRGSAGEYQADEQAGVAGLRNWKRLFSAAKYNENKVNSQKKEFLSTLRKTKFTYSIQVIQLLAKST